jgi:hypothetical protein
MTDWPADWRPLLEELHVGGDIRLILLAEYYGARNSQEKLRVMSGHVFQRLSGIVVEIGSGVLNAPQYGYLERVQVGCGSWLVDPAGD